MGCCDCGVPYQRGKRWRIWCRLGFHVYAYWNESSTQRSGRCYECSYSAIDEWRKSLTPDQQDVMARASRMLAEILGKRGR